MERPRGEAYWITHTACRLFLSLSLSLSLSLLCLIQCLMVACSPDVQAAGVRFPAVADVCSSDSCLKWRSRVLRPVLTTRKRSQCLTYVRMSDSPLSLKFPTVALQWSKSSASVHNWGRIETPGTCAFNIHSLSLFLFTLCHSH